MLKLIQLNSSSYEVRIESNNKLIGKFIQDVDGFFYFSEEAPREGGLWSDYVLLELGTKLKEINQPWSDHLDNFFKTDQP